MKKLVLLLLGVAFVVTVSQSCVSYYYQLCETTFDSDMTQTESSIMWENEDCTVNYDFWGKNGRVGFFVFNKTDSVMTIDLTRTFFVKNLMSSPYYNARQWEVNEVHSSGISAGAKYATINALAALGAGNYSASVSAYQNISSFSSVNMHSSKATKNELPYIKIAPHAACFVEDYSILDECYRDCDLKERPRQDNSSSISFNKENSPVNFANIITYQVGKQQEKMIKNSFYIHKITNFAEGEIRKPEEARRCGKSLGYVNYVKVFPIEHYNNAFYIEYSR